MATATRDRASIDLYWLPLGAGGCFVQLNGRVFEAVQPRLERRRPRELYHSGLEVRIPEGRFIIEMTPIPDGDGAARGVVGEGPVGSRRAARFRVFRYELRCWRNGVITDADKAVARPHRLTDDLREAHRLLDLVPSVPRLVWGRDEVGAAKCGTPTPSSRGCSLEAVCLRTESGHQQAGGRPAGMRVS